MVNPLAVLRQFQQVDALGLAIEHPEVALTVVKAGSAQKENEVDGVTGATLTSNGVAAMVKDGLTAYGAFLGETERPEKAECSCPVGESEETDVEQ